MIVEWLRATYQSRWLLFQRSGEYTVGRYYEARHDAEHYPGWHNLGSRNWHDRNWEILQGLGEVLDTPHLMLDGRFGGIRPESVFVGSPTCLAEGEPIGDQVEPGTLFAGYPEACYIPPAPPQIIDPLPMPANQDFERMSAFTRCQVQRFWCRILEWSYENDQAAITQAVTDFADGAATITFHRPANPLPAITTVVTPRYCIAAIDGTRNAQQFALQAFQSISGPVDQGSHSTLPLWQEAAAYTHLQLVNDGVNDTRPVFLVGHSYGAAAALILAAMYRFGVATRTVKYLTFGCPKVGDTRLSTLLLRCDGFSLANDNDLVTIVPPDPVTMAAVAVLFPLTSFLPWYQWERPVSIMTQDLDGELSPGPPEDLDFGTLFRMTTRAVLGQEQESILGHSIGEYNRRLALRCPDAGWPVSAEVIDDIEQPDQVGGGVIVAGRPGTWSGSGCVLAGGGNRPPTPSGGVTISGGNRPPSYHGGVFIGGS